MWFRTVREDIQVEPEPLCPDRLRRLLVAPAGPLARLVVVDSTGSTNDDVLAGLRDDPDAWPTGSLMLAEHQTHGRGRAGRTWVTAPGTSLIGTFVVRLPCEHDRAVRTPELVRLDRVRTSQRPPGGLGWLPLVVGLGVVQALRSCQVDAWLKWPNDVLVVTPLPAEDVDGWGSYRKVAGILAQATPDQSAVVLGVGLNVTQGHADLPVPTATSVALAGGPTDREALLVALVEHLDRTLRRWCAADPAVAGEISQVCTTLGRTVHATLPGGATVVGKAVRLADDAALVIADGATEHHVRAGDVLF